MYISTWRKFDILDVGKVAHSESVLVLRARRAGDGAPQTQHHTCRDMGNNNNNNNNKQFSSLTCSKSVQLVDAIDDLTLEVSAEVLLVSFCLRMFVHLLDQVESLHLWSFQCSKFVKSFLHFTN